MKLSLYAVLGNRLWVASCTADDDELRRRTQLAEYCFARGRRIADGVALFSRRPGFLRTAFYNPDGSLERLCGNSLLVAARDLTPQGASIAVSPFGRPVIELVHSTRGYLEARSAIELSPRAVEVPDFGPALVFDTGSPHAVLSVNHRAFELEAAGRAFVRDHDVNLTIVKSVQGVFHARTLERGVGAETAACGTGALAVAIAAERFDEWLDIRYCGGRYAVMIQRAANALSWTLRTEAGAVRREDERVILQDEAGPCELSGSSSTRCST